MLFCDKVNKDDIQVQFYTEEESRGVTWKALGEFQSTDVHKQYGICLRTPKYNDLEVFSMLYNLTNKIQPTESGRAQANKLY